MVFYFLTVNPATPNLSFYIIIFFVFFVNVFFWFGWGLGGAAGATHFLIYFEYLKNILKNKKKR